MTNWQDPSVIADNYVALGKMSWACGSIVLWEWITTLGFEWRIITRQMDLKWPMLVCVISRLSMLGYVITTFVLLSLTTEFNCDAAVRGILALGYLSICLVSFLIALRTVAIWNWHKYVTVLVVCMYLFEVAWMIYGVVPGIHSFWDPAFRSCIEINTSSRKIPIVIVFATDVCLLIITLVGLKLHKGSGSLVKLMAQQGVIWFMIAMTFYIPLVTILYLDFNDPINLIFELIVTCAMSICGNRMQIHLYQYARAGISTSEPTVRFAREPQLASGTSDHSGRTFVPFGRLQKIPDTHEQELYVIGNKPISEDRLAHESV